MGVVIIMTAVMAPIAGSMMSERRLNAAATQLQQDVRWVQQSAISTRVPNTITLQSSGYQFIASGRTVVRSLPPSVVMSLGPGWTSPLRFDALGRPSQGTAPGSALPSGGAQVVFSNGTASLQIGVTVSPVLARVTVRWIAR
jgi:hypothetical protein